MIYIKDKEVYDGGVLVIADLQIVNPTHEQLITAGWTQEEDPVPTAEEVLGKAKRIRLYELERYDTSTAVNAITFNGVETWLDAQTRANYRNSIESAEILGETSVTVGLAGQAVVLSIMEAKIILAKIQRYADACYMVTQGHRKAIQALATVEDVQNYDYTQGYPEKLAISE